MKKIFLLALSILLCAVFLFSMMACNVTVDPNDNDDDDEELKDNDGATTILSVSTLTKADEYKTMVRWANAYMALNEDVQIKVNNNMSSMDIVASWSQAGNLPDVVWTAGDQHSYWSSIGYFVDLREFLIGNDANFFDDFYTSLIDSTHYADTDDGIWFMPRDYNQLTLFLNAELFQEANIPLPGDDWTFADFINICAKWREYESTQKYYPVEMDYSWSPLSVTLMANFGASIYTNGILSADSDEMENFMNYMYDFIHNKKYVGNSSGGFSGGYSPMMVSVRPNLPTLVNSDMNIKVIARPFPSTTTAPNGVGYVGVGCSGYAITKACSTENKAVAWDFLSYCMSEEGYEKVGSLGTIVPALQSLANKGSWTEYTDSFGNKIDTVAFTSGLAEPISVNFCSNIKPDKQESTATYLMQFFNSLQVTSFDYNNSLTNLINGIGSYT